MYKNMLFMHQKWENVYTHINKKERKKEGRKERGKKKRKECGKEGSHKKEKTEKST